MSIARLQTLENKIADGLQAVGFALQEIRDERLYTHAGYDSFKAYVEGRGWSRGYAYQLMQGANIIGTIEGVLPEAHGMSNHAVLQLAPLAPDEQKLVAIFIKTYAPNREKITAVAVREMVNVMRTFIDTGAINVAGEAVPNEALLSSITESVYEAMLRQREHIREASAPKWTARGGLVGKRDKDGRVILEIVLDADVAIPFWLMGTPITVIAKQPDTP